MRMKSWVHFLFLWNLLSSLTVTWVQAWNNFGATTRSNGWNAFQKAAVAKVPSSNIKLLILPGFGNDAMDYYLPQAPEGSLVKSLEARGWKNSENDDHDQQIWTLPLQRSDWLQVFWRGCWDVQFWAGTAPPTRPAFRWYLDRIQSTVQQMCQNNNDYDDIAVVLICHSAGGWLARAALGACKEEPSLRRKVAGVVTLGSPHLPPPPQVMDMTRGALLWTDQTFPGAYFKDKKTNDDDDANPIFYLTVMGDAIAGQAPSSTEGEKASMPWEPKSPARFAYDSYQVVCGDGTTRGDGVVPLCAGHLQGATQLTLEGVFHSINAPARWYGSDQIIDRWHDVLLQEIDQWTKTTKQQKKKTKQSASSSSSFFGLFSEEA